MSKIVAVFGGFVAGFAAAFCIVFAAKGIAIAAVGEMFMGCAALMCAVINVRMLK